MTGAEKDLAATGGEGGKGRIGLLGLCGESRQ
jgi:hypothetical protein